MYVYIYVYIYLYINKKSLKNVASFLNNNEILRLPGDFKYIQWYQTLLSQKFTNRSHLNLKGSTRKKFFCPIQQKIYRIINFHLFLIASMLNPVL